MIRNLFLIVLFCLASLQGMAQNLAPITWSAYGLTFNAPKGIGVEEDTEETFLLNNNNFYITIQALDSDGMTKDDLEKELLGLADEDGMTKRSSTKKFELPQFYGNFVHGNCDVDKCCYCYLMTKAAGNVFFVSVIYSSGEEAIAERILKSFKMDEE